MIAKKKNWHHKRRNIVSSRAEQVQQHNIRRKRRERARHIKRPQEVTIIRKTQSSMQPRVVSYHGKMGLKPDKNVYNELDKVCLIKKIQNSLNIMAKSTFSSLKSILRIAMSIPSKGNPNPIPWRATTKWVSRGTTKI